MKRIFAGNIKIVVILTIITTEILKANTGWQLGMVNIFDWAGLKDWFLSLGEKYNVNPWIFGGIYVGAIPFFSLSIGILIRNLRRKKPIVFPAIFAGFFFVSAYLYLIIAGENVPFWVYIFIIVLVIYGVYSTLNKIKKGVAKAE